MNRAPADRDASNVSITVALSTLMIAVATALAAILVLFGYERNHAIALIAAEDMLATVSRQIEERTLRLVEPVVSVAALAPDLAPIGIGDDGINPTFRAFLTHVVERQSSVDSVFVGFSDGSFFQVASLDAYSSGYREESGAPATAKLVQYDIRQDAHGDRQRQILYLGDDGEPVGPARSESTAFDPRRRPWYSAALDADSVIGTPPYRFDSSGELGLTVSRRLPGQRVGVLGVDLTLVELKRFLEVQKPTADSRLYLTTPEGGVLAWAGDAQDGGPEGSTRDATGDIPNLADFSDPFSQLMHATLTQGAELPAELDHDGETYITRLEPLVGPLGSTSFIGIIVPANHFTSHITALGRNSALVSILLILVAVPLIALASRVFSRPLNRLAVEAEAIRSFQLDGTVHVPSRVREIRALSTSMDRMKSGLRTFGVYMPKDLVRQMMASSSAPKLGGERREVTVLFTDIAGFTPIADGLDPEIVMDRMSMYFETITTALRAEGGTIDKFMGDAVMAMWNALVDDPEHPASACRGILAARRALGTLNARLLEDGLAPMPTRFGLHTGEAVVGNVGSTERMNFTALGATVNLAARLEPLNKVYGTEILVSDAVARRVRKHFSLRTVAVVKPKGVGAPLRVHELLGERAEPDEPSWIHAWERAFEAFLAGDFNTAEAALLKDVADAPATDPLRERFLERIARERAAAPEVWEPVDLF